MTTENKLTYTYGHDFYKSTKHLSVTEVGVYIRLCTFENQTGFISHDLVELAKITGCSKHIFRNAWKNIKGFYEEYQFQCANDEIMPTYRHKSN